MLCFAIERSQVIIPRVSAGNADIAGNVENANMINALFHLYGSDLRKSAFILPRRISGLRFVRFGAFTFRNARSWPSGTGPVQPRR
jgi:hypothetical protein